MNQGINDNLYNKQINCPVCGIDFDTKKVRTSAIRIVNRDEDFCPHYKSENPLFYSVYVCPNCGYAALESDFTKISERNKEIIKKTISSKWNQRSYGEKRKLEDAIEVYKLALLNHQIIHSPKSTIGKLCLRLAWFYRYINNDREKEFIKYTIDSFYEAYTLERIDKEDYDEVIMLYLLGELNRRIGNYKEAVKWFDKALSNPDINRKRHIKLKARQQWSLAREENSLRKNQLKTS